jgi:hypothetical protein
MGRSGKKRSRPIPSVWETKFGKRRGIIELNEKNIEKIMSDTSFGDDIFAYITDGAGTSSFYLVDTLRKFCSCTGPDQWLRKLGSSSGVAVALLEDRNSADLSSVCRVDKGGLDERQLYYELLKKV